MKFGFESLMTITPIFLVASQRSGTTLLRLMLNSHPNIHWERWKFVCEIIGDNGEAPSTEQIQSLQEKLGMPNLKKNQLLNSSDPFKQLHNLLQTYMSQYIENEQTQIFGVTVHKNFRRLYYLWPNARFIHLIRDPRDIAISVEKLGWESTFWHAASFWVKAEQEWRILKNKISSDNWTEVRYEDLVRDTKTELTKICNILDVPYTDSFFDYTKKTSYGLPDPILAERWRGKMSPRNISLVEARAGNIMLAYGYNKEGREHHPGKIESIYLGIQNSIFNRIRRIKEQSFITYCLGILVNQFHISIFKTFLENRLSKNREKGIIKLESQYNKISKDD